MRSFTAEFICAIECIHIIHFTVLLIDHNFHSISENQKKQTLLFSATWPKEIQRLAAEFLTDPVQVNVGDANNLNANKDITGSGGKPTNSKKDANSTGVNKALKEAKKEMTALQRCISSASSLLSAIKAGGEWTWARSEAIQGETTKMLASLESQVGAIPLYGLLRLHLEGKDIKKKLAAADLQMQSTQIKNLKPDASALTEKVQAAMRANEGLKALSGKSLNEGVQPTRGKKRKTA